MLAERWTKPDFGPQFRMELRALTAAGVPLGLTGLMVSAYDAMDAIALTRWSTSGEVGVFTVAMRLLMLAVIAEQALATAAFPMLAARWNRDRTSFLSTMQGVLDWGTVVGGGLFCALQAGALGLGALANQDPQAIAAVLQLLSWAILARVVVTLVSPLAVISGRLRYTVWISGIVVTAKWLALIWLARDGATGAATAYLIAEIGVGLRPTIILCQRAAGMRLDWSVPIKSFVSAAIVATAAKALAPDATLLHGMLAIGAYLALASCMGAIRRQALRQFYLGMRHSRDGHA
jgi:O-antigen/teichoic acid export membrane protein